MIDETTGAQVGVTEAVSAIHAGDGYIVSRVSAIDAFDIAAPFDFLVTTPDTAIRVHMRVHGTSNTPAVISIYEDSGVLATFDVEDGTIWTPIQQDRNSSNTSAVVVVHTPTVNAATANLLQQRMSGKAGGHQNLQFILKQNTNYLFRFISLVDDNEGSFVLEWDEKIHKKFTGSVGAV